jgi:hypothetical protein
MRRKNWVDKEYHVGDIVEIVDPGHCYDRYSTWAFEYKIPNWCEGNWTKKGMHGTVICVAPHCVTVNKHIYENDPKYMYQIVAVRISEDRDVLIGNEGIRLISRDMIEDELFEI